MRLRLRYTAWYNRRTPHCTMARLARDRRDLGLTLVHKDGLAEPFRPSDDGFPMLETALMMETALERAEGASPRTPFLARRSRLLCGLSHATVLLRLRGETHLFVYGQRLVALWTDAILNIDTHVRHLDGDASGSRSSRHVRSRFAGGDADSEGEFDQALTTTKESWSSCRDRAIALEPQW